MTTPLGTSQRTVEQTEATFPQNHTAWLGWSQPKAGLRLLIIVLLVLGVFFRCVNLDRKVYWGDEAYTSIRLAGYRTEEIIRQVFDGHLVNREYLLKYQRLNPQKSVVDTVEGLAIEEPQLTPLYFVTARFWAQWFGDSVAAVRSLSVLFSLLAFPCLYWLCLELFQSRLVAGVAMAVFAVSPLQMLYAQEARPYSLWTLTMLLSSATLLWAVRKPTKFRWVAYAVTVLLGLYTFMFSMWVTLAHGIYLLALSGFRWSKHLTGYLLASVAGVLAFIPWLWVAISYKLQQSSDPYFHPSLIYFLKHWGGNLSRAFADFNLTSDWPLIYLLPIIPLTVILGVLMGYALYFTFRNTPQRTWLFIATLIGVPTTATIFFCFKIGYPLGYIAGRYIMPAYLGIQIAVSYLLATKLTYTAGLRRQKPWQLVAIVLFSLGVISGTMSSQAEEWWTKGYGYCNPPIARIINKAPSPLVIADTDSLPNKKWDANVANVLSLSYLVKPKVQFELLNDSKLLNIPSGFDEVFLFAPSQKLRDKIDVDIKYKLEPLYTSIKPYEGSYIRLWKLTQL